MSRDQRQEPEVSLITPMFNEAEHIRGNLRSILVAMQGLDISWEYILVDDGSTDNSLAIAGEMLNAHPCCRIIHYPRNRGRGYALRQGFSQARGRYIITTESDLTWGPEIIGRLYSEISSSLVDMVVASVNLPGGGLENVPTTRQSLSRGGNLIMRMAFGGNLTMLSGMTRAYRREVIDSLYLEQNDKEIHLEIVTKAMALGFTITEIPATIRWPDSEAKQKSKGKSRWRILRFVLPHMMMSLNQGAVRFLTWTSLGFGVIGLMTMTIGVFNKLFLFSRAPVPFLVNYGLILVTIGLICGLFSVISLQLQYVYQSLIHVQSLLRKEHQLKSCHTEIRTHEQE